MGARLPGLGPGQSRRLPPHLRRPRTRLPSPRRRRRPGRRTPGLHRPHRPRGRRLAPRRTPLHRQRLRVVRLRRRPPGQGPPGIPGPPPGRRGTRPTPLGPPARPGVTGDLRPSAHPDHQPGQALPRGTNPAHPVTGPHPEGRTALLTGHVREPSRLSTTSTFRRQPPTISAPVPAIPTPAGRLTARGNPEACG